jgi:sigma-B regulation protein RsbU (phosphoserine phosphatase)
MKSHYNVREVAQLVRMPRSWGQYLVLSAFLALTVAQQAGAIRFIAGALLHPDEVAAEPFGFVNSSNRIANGPLAGNALLAVNGQPFRSINDFLRLVHRSKPGDPLRLTLSDPSGAAREEVIAIPAHVYDTTADYIVTITLNIVIPLVALGLGFGVAFVRPRDWNAWLLLFLMRSFSSMMAPNDHISPFPVLSESWDFFWSGAWSLWMLLFGIYFPRRLRLDQSRPGLKYILVVPMLATTILYDWVRVRWLADVNAAIPHRSFFMGVNFTTMTLTMLGVAVFFLSLGYKAGTDVALDSRRRLRILMAGAVVSLTPGFFALIRALLLRTGLFHGLDPALVVYILLSLAAFPFVLAYVIVVERAMDLSIVIRQGVKYSLARGGLWALRIIITAIIFIFIRQEFTRREGVNPYKIVGPLLGLVVIQRRYTGRASDWLDRKFFREAYNAEKVLAELATEVSRYVEVGPLAEKVATRIAGTLHVDDIVILLQEGMLFRPLYSTRPGEPMNIDRQTHIAARLHDTGSAQVIDFQNPAEWLHTLDAQELQTLDFMRTHLLLPLPGKNDLAGVMSLGAKRSEAPYSPNDIRLLESIAGQMGLAIENARLLASLAAEAANRERINRELEIAREVQERLFPQKFPPIPGLDCAGYCRPARGVGGDYYDFLQLADGRLGIAIGDVSGKGIAAALLMASLQASLRGQTMAGIHDLSALMKNVNRLVYEASTSNRYATFFYGEYDLASRVLTYVNGGHNAPVVLRGDEVLHLETGGPVVGLLPGAVYAEGRTQLQPGDIFIGYTDGISEAPNEAEEEWEEERFLVAARQASAEDAASMIRSIFRAADAFTGAAKQFDDMTLLVVKLLRT